MSHPTLRFYSDSYYECLEKPTYSTSLVEAFHAIPPSVKTLLDVGCAEGNFGMLIKTLRPDIQVTGIEFQPYAASIAYQRLNQVLEVDIQAEIPANSLEQNFDCITFLDVLEHVVDPYFSFEQILQFLKPDGFIVFSIPNVRWQNVLINWLYNGSWKDDNGVLDYPHLRFFTLQSILKFLMHHHLQFDSDMIGVGQPLIPRMIPILDMLEKMGLSRSKIQLEFETFQYVFRAAYRKNPPANLKHVAIINRLWTLDEICLK